MEMTAARWEYLCRYSEEVFGREDEQLAGLMQRARAAGLPDIAIGPDMGRLLMILTSLTPGRRAIEVGTLAGYSATWIVRGLSPHGRLIAVESELKHARFAAREFESAGIAHRVDLRIGRALEVLPDVAREIGPQSTDVVFLDAVKAEYLAYWEIIRPLLAVGGLILADNVYGSDWTIDEESNPTREMVDRFNRTVAADEDFETTAVPIRNGVLIGRRIRAST